MIKVITDIAEADEPVSLALAKEALKVEHTKEDNYISLLIKSARRQCERYVGLSFGPKVLEISSFHGCKADLPYGPLREVEVDGEMVSIISVTDYEGKVVALADWLAGPTYFYHLSGRVTLNTYPTHGPYTIRYYAGYPVGQCDPDIIEAMLKTIAESFENRGNSVTGTIIQEIPQSAKAMLDRIKPNVIISW